MIVFKNPRKNDALTLILSEEYKTVDSFSVQLYSDNSFLNIEARSTVNYELLLVKATLSHVCMLSCKTSGQIFQLFGLSVLNTNKQYIRSMGITYNPEIEIPAGNYSGFVLFWKGNYINKLPSVNAFDTQTIPPSFIQNVLSIGKQMFKPGIIVPMRYTYLDAKVNELISVVVNFYSGRTPVLKPDILAQLKTFEDAVSQQLKHLPQFNQLAYSAGVNPGIIRKYFTDYFGCNFRTYVQKLRLKKAKELLIQTRLTVSEIAEISGYDYEYSFIRSFRKHFGLTPLQFRNKTRPE